MDIFSVNRDELSNVMRQYYDLKMEHKDVFVFFQLGDFYEMFFNDAIEVANLLELTLTSKSAGLKEKIPMCGVPLRSVDEYVRQLVRLEKKVALVDQEEVASDHKGLVGRKLRKIITPGTFQDLNNKDNNFLVSLEQTEEVRLSYLDVATGEGYNVSFLNLSQAVEYILKMNVKELIINTELDENIVEELKYHSVFVNQIHELFELEIKASFNPKYQLVNQIMYSYLKQNNQAVTHITSFDEIIVEDFMQLSINSQKQLELIETLKDQQYQGSLFSFLNKTKTAMGRRELKKIIISPLINQLEIDKRHNLVESLMRNPLVLNDLETFLGQIYDFERIIGRINDQVVNPKELEQLKKSLTVLPSLRSLLAQIEIPEVEKLLENYDDLTDVLGQLVATLTDEPPFTIKEGGIIAQGFNEEVDRLREISTNSSKWLIDFEIRMREETGIKNLKVKYNRIFGYFIEVTNSFISMVPDAFVRKQTMSNCERYITEELKEAENDILNAVDRLNNLEYAIYIELRTALLNYIPRLKKVAKIIAQIDVFSSFAKVALENRLSRPIFDESSEIKITELRHPIVEKTVNNYIVNDLEMTEAIDVLLITGPNMSGKSTYMRSVAINVIMAQIGCFVAAKEMKISVFDKIFTRIGASDDLSQGQSTFMVEMAETSQAIKGATAKSLILFDELGRGTSTYDGLALAKAIIEYIIDNIQAKTLFSTHYHELTQMESQVSKIKNVHVKAKEEDGGLTFFHKVLPGAVQKSYGIEVANLAKLPNEIIIKARHYMNQLEMEKANMQMTLGEVDIKAFDEITKLTDENQKLTEFVNKIKSVDINSLTPIEAINLLVKLKEEDVK
ncbi:MAG: DNA mismatch repair protein MutS [Mycoplasmatales bacterium]